MTKRASSPPTSPPPVCPSSASSPVPRLTTIRPTQPPAVRNPSPSPHSRAAGARSAPRTPATRGPAPPGTRCVRVTSARASRPPHRLRTTSRRETPSRRRTQTRSRQSSTPCSRPSVARQTRPPLPLPPAPGVVKHSPYPFSIHVFHLCNVQIAAEKTWRQQSPARVCRRYIREHQKNERNYPGAIESTRYNGYKNFWREFRQRKQA